MPRDAVHHRLVRRHLHRLLWARDAGAHPQGRNRCRNGPSARRHTAARSPVAGNHWPGRTVWTLRRPVLAVALLTSTRGAAIPSLAAASGPLGVAFEHEFELLVVPAVVMPSCRTRRPETSSGTTSSTGTGAPRSTARVDGASSSPATTVSTFYSATVAG